MVPKASDEDEPDVEAHAVAKASDDGDEDEPDVEAHMVNKLVEK
jgi:hypothetical protein